MSPGLDANGRWIRGGSIGPDPGSIGPDPGSIGPDPGHLGTPFDPAAAKLLDSLASRREGASVRVVVLADTHAPRRWRVCPPRVAEHLRRADLILHAGDVCTASVLTELAEYAPVFAVLGNNDGPDVAQWGAPETAELDLDGFSVAMVHDSGPAVGRIGRMRRKFPDASLVVFGHSHI